MLTESQLIGYIEGTLPADERTQVEAALAQDAALRQRVLEQMRLDAALRATLGGVKAGERVKQSVLAVLRGESDAALKRQVLEDTTHLHRPAATPLAAAVQQRPWLPAIGDWLSALLRRPAWAAGLAAACIVLALGVWMIVRSNPAKPDEFATLETPQRVDFPAGTEMFPRPGTKIQFNNQRPGSFTPQPADGLRVGESASGTITYADGTILHLEPGTEIRFVVANRSNRTGGKQLRLVRGTLSADVAKQPASLPLLIHTPHATITVVGTEFDLTVGTNTTLLEVTHGLVKMSGTNAAASIDVAAGEVAVASPDAPPRSQGLARNPLLRPFRSDSPWNTPLGRSAQYETVRGTQLLADDPVVDALRSRRPFMGGAVQPLHGVWINGVRRIDARFNNSSALPNARRDTLVLLQSGRRFAYELRGVTARADGDLDAEAMERIDLGGPGFVSTPNAAVPFGLSGLGGLIRVGELESGIHHALAARVPRERLGGRRDFSRPSTVWPASGGDVPGNEFLNIGTLLALPPEVDIRKLAGDSGPDYELARALQDYGVYVTGTIGAPFALLTDGTERNASQFDALLNQLVPLLLVVRNNTAQTPGGGGEPRRPAAPKFPNEVK